MDELGLSLIELLSDVRWNLAGKLARNLYEREWDFYYNIELSDCIVRKTINDTLEKCLGDCNE